MRRCASLAGCLLLAGCAGAPTNFFVLDPTPPTRPVAATAAVVPIQVVDVHIPADLDRPELVTEFAANRLHLSEQNHWGAPLGEMIRRVLSQDLDSRLPAGTVAPPDGPAPAGARRLVVDIVEFRSDAEGRVDLQGSWTLLASGAAGRSSLSHAIRLTADPGGVQAAPAQGAGAQTAGVQAAAMSRILGELSDDISAALTAASPPA